MPGELRTKSARISRFRREGTGAHEGVLPLQSHWLREDFSLRDGDSVLDVFVSPSSYRCIIWSWSHYRGGTERVVASIYGTGRIFMDVLFQWYGRIDATWYVTPATQLLSNLQLCFVGTVPSTGRPGWSIGPLTKGTVPSTVRPSLVDRSVDRGHRPEERPLLSRYPCGRCRS